MEPTKQIGRYKPTEATDRGCLSRATMGRLPGYLSYLRSLPIDRDTVSATAIAHALSLGEVQVRKDLSAVCGAGKPRVGYRREVLAEAIESVLGMHTECEAVIVGAGKLGRALLEFGGFAEYGITVARAFDIAPEKRSDRVLAMEELPSYCDLHRVQIGILTVPPEAAQKTASLLVKSGIRAIWCFAPIKLELPQGVSVRYENMALSLAHLHRSMLYGNI